MSNLVLACDHCHSLINDSEAGWKTVVLGDDSQFPGRTAWIAPDHIDPTGTPRVNHRHRAGELLAEVVAGIHARWEREHAADQHRLRERKPGDTAA